MKKLLLILVSTGFMINPILQINSIMDKTESSEKINSTKNNNARFKKEVEIRNSALYGDTAGISGWFNGTPSHQTTSSKIVDLSPLGKNLSDVKDNFSSLRMNGVWRTVNYARKKSKDQFFDLNLLYSQPKKSFNKEFTFDDIEKGTQNKVAYVEWDQHSGKNYNNATANIKLEWADQQNLLLKMESTLIVKARVGGLIWKAYTLGDMDILPLVAIPKKESTNITSIKMKDSVIDVGKYEKLGPNELKHQILLDIAAVNSDQKIVSEIIKNIIERPEWWTISDIDFKIPPKGTSRDYTSKFNSNYNNIKYNGYLLSNVRLTNL